MSLNEAAALEAVAQDRGLLWTRLFHRDAIEEIETGVSPLAWDQLGVTSFARVCQRAAGAR